MGNFEGTQLQEYVLQFFEIFETYSKMKTTNHKNDEFYFWDLNKYF